jgi:Glycosyl transferase family group 2
MQWSLGVLSYMIPQSPVTAPCSAYSISSTLAHTVGGWDAGPSAIGEDYHMYLKCFFATRAKLVIVKIFSPASQSNIEGSKPGFWSGFKARYVQAKRHWWASLDVGYTIRRSVYEIFASGWDSPNNQLQKVEMVSGSKTSTIFFISKLVCLWYAVFEEHFFLSQAIIMIATSSVIIPPGLIPAISNGYWNVFSTQPPSSLLLFTNTFGNYSRLCGAGLYILGVVSYEYYQEWNGRTRWSEAYRGKVGKRSCIQAKRGFLGPLDWLSFPLFSVFFVIIPQMHAQIIQLWTENLDYVVAAKPMVVDGPAAIDMVEVKDEILLVKALEPADSKDTL